MNVYVKHWKWSRASTCLWSILRLHKSKLIIYTIKLRVHLTCLNIQSSCTSHNLLPQLANQSNQELENILEEKVVKAPGAKEKDGKTLLDQLWEGLARSGPYSISQTSSYSLTWGSYKRWETWLTCLDQEAINRNKLLENTRNLKLISPLHSW